MKSKLPPTIQQKLQNFRKNNPKQNFNKSFGVQSRVTIMQNIQRASGRRGN